MSFTEVIMNPGFRLVQVNLLVVGFSFMFSLKGYKTIVNESVIFKTIGLLVLLSSFIILIIEFSWWLAIFLFIISFFIQNLIAAFITNFLIPKSFYYEFIKSTHSDFISSIKNIFSLIFINLVYLTILLNLIGSIIFIIKAIV